MIIFDMIFGLLLLFAGRNLFWLCVGIVGFLIGVQSATLLGFTDGMTALMAALGLGIIGIVLAICFEWVAIVFGVGFLGGGYLVTNIFSFMALQDSFSWPVFVVGGIVGMCLMIIAFDLTLILLSSLLGATLIVTAFHGSEELRDIIFMASMVVGVVVQYLALKETPREDSKVSKKEESRV